MKSLILFLAATTLALLAAIAFGCPELLHRVEVLFIALSALGEAAIALVIYWEWEGTRLDQFLEDADKKTERKSIFEHYCGLTVPAGKARNVQFMEDLELEANHELKDTCDENIRLFSRIGARLPIWPSLKKRALEWHVVVFLWEILGPYVLRRREEAGPSFAITFLQYALASTTHILKQRRDKWTIRDPKPGRSLGVDITKPRLVEIQQELQAALEQS